MAMPPLNVPTKLFFLRIFPKVVFSPSPFLSSDSWESLFLGGRRMSVLGFMKFHSSCNSIHIAITRRTRRWRMLSPEYQSSNIWLSDNDALPHLHSISSGHQYHKVMSSVHELQSQHPHHHLPIILHPVQLLNINISKLATSLTRGLQIVIMTMTNRR